MNRITIYATCLVKGHRLKCIQIKNRRGGTVISNLIFFSFKNCQNLFFSDLNLNFSWLLLDLLCFQMFLRLFSFSRWLAMLSSLLILQKRWGRCCGWFPVFPGTPSVTALNSTVLLFKRWELGSDAKEPLHKFPSFAVHCIAL